MVINAPPEQIGLASFVDEAGICSEVPATTTNHYTVLDGSEIQSIKEYLARPRLITTGNISAGAGFLTNLNFPTSAVLRSYLTATHFDRLKGAVGIRATMKFTLTVAATPFHQGILTLNWQYATDGDGFPLHTRSFFLPYATNLPHVRLDLAENTMVSLDVPYVSHLEYFPIDLNSDVNIYYGVLGIMKQTNFRVIAGQNPPEFSLYISLHDVEVVGAVPYTTSSILLQSGSSGNAKGKSEATKEKLRGGLISKALGQAADVARTLSYVPSLNAIGGAADWFLRSASKVASAFGYSKPIDENKPTRVNTIAYAGDTHVDMPFQGFTTSPFITNKLAINSALGCTDDDQLALDYVLTKPSLIYRGQMSETDNIGDPLYAGYVCPSHYWYRDKELAFGVPNGNIAMPANATGTKNCILPSTLMYVANNFRYWRGDIRYRITFSKSNMHAGRVQFSFVPYSAVPAANLMLPNAVFTPDKPSSLVQPTGMTTIFDLRDGTTFDFVVPYISTDPYMTYEGAIGAVSMTVIHALRSPGVASSTIDFLVEVSAEPGFELACFCPATLDGMQPNGVADVTYQSGAVVPSVSDASQNVIGEKFNSLKQLMMIPSWTSVDINNNTVQRITLTPWFKYNGVPVAAPYGNTANDTALHIQSPCMRVARMFSFANGSTNYTLFRDGGTTQNFTASAYAYPNTSGATFTEIGSLWNRNSNAAGGLMFPETTPNSRWSVPSFSRFVRLPLAQMFAAYGGYQRALTPGGIGTVNYNPVFVSHRTDLLVRNSSGATRRLALGRSAGDDARASQFIGPPPCAFYPAGLITPPVFVGDQVLGVSPF